MVAWIPRRWAWKATAWAWLPALAATTPRLRSSGASRENLLAAPRSLNEPVRCRFSSLKWIRAPQSSLNGSESGHGVTPTRPRMRSRAASTSCRVSMARQGDRAGPSGQVVMWDEGAFAMGCASSRKDSVWRLGVRMAGKASVGVVERLTGGDGGGPSGPRGAQRGPRGVPHDMDPIELVPEDADGALGKMFRSIRTHLGLGIVPDDFRALGRWPKYLELAWSDARKRDGEAQARIALNEIGGSADDAARQLPVRAEITAEALRAAGADPARVRALLQRFRRTLPGLVLDLALFKVQLDGAEAARESPFPIRWKYISSDEYTTVGLDEPVKLRAGDPKDLDEEERPHRPH